MDLKEQYERESGEQWLPWNMTSQDWQRRVDWLEAKIAAALEGQTPDATGVDAYRGRVLRKLLEEEKAASRGSWSEWGEGYRHGLSIAMGYMGDCVSGQAQAGRHGRRQRYKDGDWVRTCEAREVPAGQAVIEIGRNAFGVIEQCYPDDDSYLVKFSVGGYFAVKAMVRDTELWGTPSK